MITANKQKETQSKKSDKVSSSEDLDAQQKVTWSRPAPRDRDEQHKKKAYKSEKYLKFIAEDRWRTMMIRFRDLEQRMFSILNARTGDIGKDYAKARENQLLSFLENSNYEKQPGNVKTWRLLF